MMEEKRREINHAINMMYRQLGKAVYDDLKKDKLNVSAYNRRINKIDGLIKTIRFMEVDMDNVEEPIAETTQTSEPVVNNEGIHVYRFCNECNAGNHPEATECIRCGQKL